MEKFKLARTKQCKKCPWRKSTNPHEIPDGYSVQRHQNLACTIANPGEIRLGGTVQVMACHESPPEKADFCIGWLHNQLGVGNNIAMRLRMMNCENAGEIRIFGAQHEKFEDTLPKSHE